MKKDQTDAKMFSDVGESLRNQWNISLVWKGHRHGQETQSWCKVKALSFNKEYDIIWEGRNPFNTHMVSLIPFTQTPYLGIPLSVRLKCSL